jgi:cold shock CspA family protein
MAEEQPLSGRGELLFFNQERGDGFIRTAEGERLFVERASFLPGEVPEGRCAGTAVEFTRRGTDGEHLFAAFRVSRIPDSPSGRARRRSPSRTQMPR